MGAVVFECGVVAVFLQHILRDEIAMHCKLAHGLAHARLRHRVKEAREEAALCRRARFRKGCRSMKSGSGHGKFSSSCERRASWRRGATFLQCNIRRVARPTRPAGAWE